MQGDRLRKPFCRYHRPGLGILGEMIGEAMEAGAKILPGDKAFKLHDTYGFAGSDQEIAGEAGLAIDEEGFVMEMEEQKKKARRP